VIGHKIIKNPGIEDPAFVHPGRVKSAVYVKGMIECWNNGKLDIKNRIPLNPLRQQSINLIS
jgi:hypothetical protein